MAGKYFPTPQITAENIIIGGCAFLFRGMRIQIELKFNRVKKEPREIRAHVLTEIAFIRKFCSDM
jgi:hypothetical protein